MKLNKKNTKRIVKYALFTFAWVYILSNIFIFNIDDLLISFLPDQLKWFVEYKFITIPLLIAILWLSLGDKRFAKNIFFFILYPFAIIAIFLGIFALFAFWILPQKLFGRSANVIIAGVLAFVMTIISSKRIVISFVLFISPCLLILLNVGKMPTVLGMVVLFIFLAKHYLSNLHNAFKPESILSKTNRILSKYWSGHRDLLLLKDYRDTNKYPRGTPEFQKKRISTIKSLLFLNQCFTLTANKLKNFYESGILFGFGIGRLVLTFVLTAITFGFEYYALEHVAPGSVISDTGTGIFSLLFCSLFRMVFMDAGGFKALTPIAMVMTVIQLMFSALIVYVLAQLIFKLHQKKHEEELKEMITFVETESIEMENLLVAEFQSSLLQAETEIKETEPDSLRTIDKIRKLMG